jgi:F420-dependent oxidoreductase-like protein
MRFGIFVPQGWRFDLVGIDPADHWATMKRLALAADAGPWESLWVYDHFHTTPVPSDEATHEAWTLMAAFGAVTDRIRLGQMCTCMAYRNPAYLAKVAATVDHVSSGRLEMGIGAGWYEHEWRAYGYGFPEAPERLRMLDQGVQIMRQAWAQGHADLDGEHYRVNGAIVRPLPIQDGGIPIWVAGGGEKVTLRIAAQYAQYTNFNGGAEEFARKSEILRGHCQKHGTDFDAITRSSNFNTIIGSTEAEVAERIDAVEARLVPHLGAEGAAKVVDQYREHGSAQAIAGTPEQIVEILQERRALGLAYAIHYFPESAYDRSGVELFEREVIPALA